MPDDREPARPGALLPEDSAARSYDAEEYLNLLPKPKDSLDNKTTSFERPSR
jgi:hypothetical protein